MLGGEPVQLHVREGRPLDRGESGSPREILDLKGIQAVGEGRAPVLVDTRPLEQEHAKT